MKKLVTLLGVMMVSTISFATTQTTSLNNSHTLNAMGSAWKKNESVKLSNNDLTIVYGGEDISNRPTIALHTTTA